MNTSIIVNRFNDFVKDFRTNIFFNILYILKLKFMIFYFINANLARDTISTYRMIK